MLDPVTPLLLMFALGSNSRRVSQTPPWPGETKKPGQPEVTPGGAVVFHPTGDLTDRQPPRAPAPRRAPPAPRRAPTAPVRRPAGVPATAKPVPGQPGVYQAPAYKTPSGAKQTGPGQYEIPETYVTAQQPTLKQGMKGANVMLVQRKLGLKEDGNFGPATKNAVVAFQIKNKLNPDGKVGPKTWKALGY